MTPIKNTTTPATNDAVAKRAPGAAPVGREDALAFLKSHVTIMRTGQAPRPLTDDEALLLARKVQG